jgi:gamma-glutamylcyclotransferase (GGCT)/AIG2-like uncharacterized protein YtfP
MHVFTYGTLMFPEVWRAVVGKQYETVAATAAGFEIYYVRDAVYPGIIAAAHGSVTGLIYFNVDAESLARLDIFEGEDYRRQQIQVTRSDNGQILQADAYVIPPANRQLLTNEPWSAQEFAARGELNRFVARYAGFERLTEECD